MTIFNSYVKLPEGSHLFHLGPMILTDPGCGQIATRNTLFATADRSWAQKDPYTACD